MARHHRRHRNTPSLQSNMLGRSRSRSAKSMLRILLQLLLKQPSRDISHTLDLASSPPTRRLFRHSLSNPTRTNQLRKVQPRKAFPQRHKSPPLVVVSLHGLSLCPRHSPRPIQTHRTLSYRHSNAPPLVLCNRSNRDNRRAHTQDGALSITQCKTKWVRWRSVQMALVNILDNSKCSSLIKVLAPLPKCVSVEKRYEYTEGLLSFIYILRFHLLAICFIHFSCTSRLLYLFWNGSCMNPEFYFMWF